MVKRSKNQLRREKAKKRKTEDTAPEPKAEVSPAASQDSPENEPELTVEMEDNPLFQQFKSVIGKFSVTETPTEVVKPEAEEPQPDSGASSDESDSDHFEIAEEQEYEEFTKRDLKRLNKVSISTLKAVSRNPQAVEWSDINAPYPYLLVSLKSSTNVIPVPSHWSAKRDFLATKRGLERQPFDLPSYIAETGISEMRSHDEQSLRQSQRERVQPKMGKLDIDYRRLHDAFFKFQTKPFVTGFGDVYYEGRESVDGYDEELNKVKPGKLSKKLMAALGISNEKTPPPWIPTMKQIGKPPAYSNLIIPGIDITYSNVGYLVDESELRKPKAAHELWGQFEAVESSESEDEESEDEDDKADYESEADDNVSGNEVTEEIPTEEVVIDKKPSQKPVEPQPAKAEPTTVNEPNDTKAEPKKKFKF